jgi:gliding motility-associated lipoprotein GldD
MNRNFLLSLFSIGILFNSCAGDYSPKPRSYFRIDLPEKKYQVYSGDCAYSFDFPVYAQILPDKDKEAKPCWIDVHYPQFNGRIHLSYQSFCI